MRSSYDHSVYLTGLWGEPNLMEMGKMTVMRSKRNQLLFLKKYAPSVTELWLVIIDLIPILEKGRKSGKSL